MSDEINIHDIKLQEKFRKKLKKELDEKRYEHTLGVAYTAACLAMCHSCDIDKAKIAGLLHDCAKCISNEKRIEICEKNNLEINDVERANPFLLHAKAGSVLAKKKYHIQDKEILSAIMYHTTGKPNMTLLEKIVFIADYIEPARNHSSRLPELRRIAFTDLDMALREILKDTLAYLHSNSANSKAKDGTIEWKSQIDPMTQMTYDYYKKED